MMHGQIWLRMQAQLIPSPRIAGVYMGLHDSVRLSRKQGTNGGVHGTRLCLYMAMPGCAVPGPFMGA